MLNIMEVNFSIGKLMLFLLGLTGLVCFYSLYRNTNVLKMYFQNEMDLASKISAAWYKENPLFIEKEIDYEIQTVRNPINAPANVKEAHFKFDKMKEFRDLIDTARTLALVLGVLCFVGTIYSLTIG